MYYFNIIFPYNLMSMVITTKPFRMVRPSSGHVCLYKYRSPEMGKTLQAIHGIFRATDVAGPLANTAVITRVRIGRAQRSGEKHRGGGPAFLQTPIVRIGDE